MGSTTQSKPRCAVTLDEFEAALKQTLADRRLSRGERHALSAVLENVDPPPTLLGAYRSRAFALARDAVGAELAPGEVVDWLEEVVKLLMPPNLNEPRSEACFSPGQTCRERIRSLFRHARHSADACVFTITDNAITEAIVAAHQRGVRVRIISDDLKANDRGSDIEVLERCGIPVRIDRTRHHMHHKFAIFDNERLLTGSYNWTVSAVRYNEENLIVTDDGRLVGEFQQVFNDLWDRFGH